MINEQRANVAFSQVLMNSQSYSMKIILISFGMMLGINYVSGFGKLTEGAMLSQVKQVPCAHGKSSPNSTSF
jgi:hypothetical protein